MKTLSKIMMMAVMTTALTAHAADEVLHLSIQEAMSSAEAKAALDPSIKVTFAGGSGSVVRKGLVSNKKTNGVGKSDEASCQRAFLSAVKQFQETAKKNGATKVINLVSFYKKQTYRSASKYECHVGNLMSGVALKGDIAR